MPTLSTALPAAPVTACPPELSEEQIAQYRRDGFIAFHSVFSPDEVARAKAALLAVVERLRTKHLVTENSYGIVWNAPDSAAGIQFQRGHAPESAEEAQIPDKVRKFHHFVGLEPDLAYLATEQPQIQGVLTSLLGPGAVMSQDMALVNPPGIGTGKPWHQDDAYFKIVPLDAVCGVWIALDDASIENGCMNFLPGWHRRGALRHYHGSDCEILPDRLAEIESEVMPVPLPSGGAVFFNGVAPHMTKPNTSTQYRRALQYHYRAQDSRLVSQEEYDAVFAETDGTPASCAAASRRGF